MAALEKFVLLSTKLLKRNPFTIHARQIQSISDPVVRRELDELNQELKPFGMRKWLPGIYPQTEEEWRNAAEKYNLHPDEYKPVPQDDYSLGDYPDLPKLSVEAKDPYYPWDMPDIRKNYHEMVHRDFDMMTEDRYAYGVRTEFDYHKCAFIFIVVFLGTLYLNSLGGDTKLILAKKQYPYNGEKHYTFEPAH